jgi:hypothetical protein
MHMEDSAQAYSGNNQLVWGWREDRERSPPSVRPNLNDIQKT